MCFMLMVVSLLPLANNLNRIYLPFQMKKVRLFLQSLILLHFLYLLSDIPAKSLNVKHYILIGLKETI